MLNQFETKKKKSNLTFFISKKKIVKKKKNCETFFLRYTNTYSKNKYK